MKKQPANLNEAIQYARQGHKTWLTWKDKSGARQFARKSPQSIKRMLLDVGTQGDWTLIMSNDGCCLKGFWWMGINLINQYKYGMAAN